MNLTEAERLILRNQYKILARMAEDKSSDKQQFEKYVEILENGFAPEYDQITENIALASLEDEYYEVVDTLNMFERLSAGLDRLEPGTFGDDESFLKFAGYDLNNEPDQLVFARFYQKEGKFGESLSNLGDLNSHCTMRDRYQRMLLQHKANLDNFVYSEDALKEMITAAKPKD